MRTLIAPTLLCTLLLVGLVPAAHAGDPQIAGAAAALGKAIAAKDVKAAEAAVEQLVATNSGEAVTALERQLSAAQTAGDRFYWFVIKGLAAFTSGEAIGEVGEFVVKNKTKSAGKDCLYWLQSNFSPYAASMLLNIVPDLTPALQVMALEHVATLKFEDSVEGLLKLLEKYGKNKDTVVDRILLALEEITGQNLGTNPETWRTWILANQGKKKPEGDGGSVTNWGSGRGKGLERVKKGEPGKIIVITASKPALNYDSIQSMLQSMKVPHIQVTKEKFNAGEPVKDAKGNPTLEGVMAIFINCTNFRERCVCPDCKLGAKDGRMFQCVGCTKHIKESDRLTPEAVARLVAFVEKGGYLFTEDMCMYEVLEVGFAKYLTPGEVLPDATVAITPASGMTTHPYLKRVFAASAERWDSEPRVADKGGSIEPPTPTFEKVEHTWKIDDQSPSIRINDANAVKVLLESAEMAKAYNVNKAVAVLVGVNAGSEINITGTTRETMLKGGRLIHVMSHFTKQNSSRDGYTMQNLLVNYLLEANERWEANAPKKEE